MNNKISSGEVLTYTAPTGGVVSGTPVQIGQSLVIPVASVAQTLPFSGETCGVFELVKNAPEVWAEGVPLYWDDGNSEVTIVADGNLPIGFAAASALSAAVVGRVALVNAGRPTAFKSAELTGTGSSQDVAHGLGVAPSLVWFSLSEFNGDDGAHDVAEGAHDATNLKFTVTTGVKFFAFALA